eukprot:Sspe_Gene.60019::Locus_33023_Transcript_1_1_Confidence_1.000_Length_1848::g.60019::m.60019/K03456/PPP2R1; serine/threonine-protein phosphatase 2A regulatory subunit A
MEEESLFPVAVLIDELKNKELATRLRATNQLRVIAEALGFERTRDELIPFITEMGNGWDDDDEVLICIAQQFKDFLDYVGGPRYAGTLLRPLEQLASMEEPTVRDKAIEAITAIAAQLPPNLVQSELSPLVKRMAEHTWATCRSSAAALIPTLYKITSHAQTRERLRATFTNLCKASEEPMVKRSAATHMADLCGVVGDDTVLKHDVIPYFAELANDEQDGVRLLVVENAHKVASAISSALAKQLILPILRKASKDPSWRVRYMLCDKLKQSCLAVDMDRTEVISLFQKLAEDTEAEVRAAAAMQVGNLGAILGADKSKVPDTKGLIAAIKRLSTDENPHVRAAAAGNIFAGLSAVLGHNQMVQTTIPLLTSLLGDQNSEVRLNVIEELSKISDMGFQEVKSHLLPAVVQLAVDAKWRVREAVIKLIPALAKQMGVDAFEQDMSKLLVGWLTDQVCEVRLLVARVLCDLCSAFGEEWVRGRLIPKLNQLVNKDNYMHRVALLNFLGEASLKLSPHIVHVSFLPILQAMSKDRVPNVRFNVAKAVEKALPRLDEKTVRDGWKSLILSLEDDTDCDVRHFARLALVKCP